MRVQQGASPAPERRRGCLSLTTWQPRKIARLGSGEQTDITDLDDGAQRFAAWLWAERNRWDISRRCGLVASGRQLDRRDAERAWREMFGKLREVAR